MPIYTDPVFIDGSQDDPQLRVQGHTTQADPLQTWEDSGNNVLARISGDGRLELGALNIAGSPSALIEANQNVSTSSVAKQGFQSRGITSAAVAEPLTWSIHELELQGDGGVSDLETALRAKVIHSNTGNSQNGRLRAGDFHVVNQSGSSSQQVNEAVAIQATITNSNGGGTAGINKAVGVRSFIQNGDTGDVINEAIGFEVAPPENTSGTINNFYGLRIPDLPTGTNRYAIQTGLGTVHFGDSVGIGTVPSTRLHVAQEGGLLNPVLENAVSNIEGNTLSFRRARNTLTSKILVNNGDSVGCLSFEAWDGTTYRKAATIEAQVAAAPSTNDMPGKLVFSTTPDGSSTPVPRMTINADGSVTLHNGLNLSDFTNSQHNHQNSAGGGTLDAVAIGSGQLALVRGGTGADLSATGGMGQILKQTTVGGSVTVAPLTASEIPTLDATAIGSGTFDEARIPALDASKITSGQLALARGGTNANLSATGGAGQVLKQSSSGGAITVAALSASEIGYTPTVLTHWNSDADPGNLDGALDQLAARMDATEGGPAVAQGRLSLVSGSPYGEHNGSGRLYFVPMGDGGIIKLYDGYSEKNYLFDEIYRDLSGLANHTVADVFAYPNGQNVALELQPWVAPPNGNVTNASNTTPITITTSAAHGLAWGDIVTISGVVGNTAANGTWRVGGSITSTTFQIYGVQAPFALTTTNSVGNGSYTGSGIWRKASATGGNRDVQLNIFRGRYTLSTDPTRLWLGTIRTGRTAGQAVDNETQRFVWNFYNRTVRNYRVLGATANTSSTTGYLPWNDDFALRFEYVCGLVAQKVSAVISGRVDWPTSGLGYAETNACHNAWWAPSLDSDAQGSPANLGYFVMPVFGQGRFSPVVGYGFLQAVKAVNMTPSPTFQTVRMGGDFWA